MPFQLNRTRRSSFRSAIGVCALLAAVVALAEPCAFSQQPSATSQTPLSNSQPKPTGTLLPETNRVPDANDRMIMNEAQAKRASYEAANLERKRQINEDSALLLKLAAELKAEIDKTSKDTLSLSVIKKAEDIERLAHNVQVKMKLSIVPATN